MNSIARRLGIDRKELDKLVLLILHSFFSAIFVSIFFSVANAEFVNNFGSDFLPVGYLLSGAVGYLTVQGYSRLLKKSGYSAFVGGLIFLLACTLLFRLALFFTDAGGTKWLSFVIFLFAMPFLAISGLEQAGLLLKIYDIREGKKYAGIVNSGGTAASIVGYLSIPVLIPFLRSRYDLFFIAICGLAIALYFLIRINKTVNLKEQKTSSGPAPVKADTSLPTLLKQKYILFIAICGGISMMAFYFVDYSFLINAKARARSPEQLSAIIGGFFAFIKAAELILSLLSGRIFRSFGLKTGIIILPALCVIVTLCAIAVYHFSGGMAFLFFVFALKFFERCVSKAIEEPTYKNLYQLLNAADRLAIQAKIDGGTKQLFIILGSVILLLYGRFMPAEHLQIGLLYISIPIFLFWLYSARQLVRAFKERLRDLLNPGNLENGQNTGSAFDRLSSLFAGSGKHSPKTHVVLDLLSHKLHLSSGKKEIQVTETALVQDTYVPHPFLKYLAPSQGGSRLELQLYKPLLVLPPTEAPVESSGPKSAEFLDEKEILQMALSGKEPNEATLTALGRKLDDLKNDHEKKLVLTILGKATHPLSTTILLQHLDYPDYYTRKQVFKTLEAKNFKYSSEEEIFYRSALEAVLSDITYVISALSSIPNMKEYDDLLRALYEEESILKNRLLSILTWMYDKASISVIRENIFAGNADTKQANNILALELIDNLVESEIKPKVMPVFESGFYLRRLSALNTWYHFPQLSLKDTLVNLLHYDYTKLGTWTKACALKLLLLEKSTEYKQIISGFSYHPNTLLRALSHEYSETFNGNTIYPLKPKEDFFATGKNKLSQLKGSEIYECIKALKENTFFKKASFGDLVRFSLFMEPKNYQEVKELATLSSAKNKPVFILEGNVILEFKKELPADVFSKSCILPGQFNTSQLLKLLTRSQTSLYELSPVHLANLLLSSDSMLGDVLRTEG